MATNFRPINEIPIKFASREIAGTEDFFTRWSDKDLAMVITDIWHGSGDPQKRLAELFQIISAIPMSADALIMFQEGKSSIDCARKFLEKSNNSQIIYDCTGTFEAQYPTGSFEWDEEQINEYQSLFALRYTGPIELIPPVVLKAYIAAIITEAENSLCELDDNSDRHWMYRPSILDPYTAKRYIDALSCGLITIPSRTESGMELSAYTEDSSVMFDAIFHALSQRRSLGYHDIAFPLPENVKRYVDDVRNACRDAAAIRRIWERSLECLPFKMGDSLEDIDDFVSKMDTTAVRAVADAIGVTSTIDAYMSGVPLEDILA